MRPWLVVNACTPIPEGNEPPDGPGGQPGGAYGLGRGHVRRGTAVYYLLSTPDTEFKCVLSLHYTCTDVAGGQPGDVHGFSGGHICRVRHSSPLPAFNSSDTKHCFVHDAPATYAQTEQVASLEARMASAEGTFAEAQQSIAQLRQEAEQKRLVSGVLCS